MIEKIDKIRDLLIVPNVDEQPKLAINQMKILNLLVELRAEAEQLTIPDVSQLLAFIKEVAEWDKDYSSTRLKLSARKILKAYCG